MSSVPMTESGNLAGLGLLACSAESKAQAPPQPAKRRVSRSSAKNQHAINPKSDPHLHSEHAGASSAHIDCVPQSRSAEHPPRQEAADETGSPEKGESTLEIVKEDPIGRQKSASKTGAALTKHMVAMEENGNGIQSDTSVKLHRIREVREQQGLSVRSIARRLGVDVKSYRQLENPCHNLSLSELHAIQVALDVPFSDLLVDRHSMAGPVQERAKLVKVMKSAVAIREAKSTPRVQRLAQMLCEQLTDLMPELSEVSGWPQFGARRGQSALGKALMEPIDTSQLGLSE